MMLQGKDNEHVIKTRRTLSGDGKKMTVEVMPITPPGKMESTVRFIFESILSLPMRRSCLMPVERLAS